MGPLLLSCLLGAIFHLYAKSLTGNDHVLEPWCCPAELSSVTALFSSALFNGHSVTSHVGMRNPHSVASVAKEMNF